MAVDRSDFKLISQGAEAKVYLSSDKKYVLKERIPKSYRISILDKQIRQFRTRRESKVLSDASKVIDCPKLFEVDDKNMLLLMEYADGQTVKNILDEAKYYHIATVVGANLAKLHDANIIHGDLTTSNMVLRKKTVETGSDAVCFIDFGLSVFSHKLEDKAVDIHLFKQALESKHYKNHEKLYELFLKGYMISKNYDAVISRLVEVEKRGRNKH